MKIKAFALLAFMASASLTGCGGGSSSAAAPAQSTPDVVTGVDTPKSVAVVTAN